MVPLQKALSRLEVEALESVEHTTNGYFVPESEQERSLDTLTARPDDVAVVALWTGTLPTAESCCCCCCCPCCCT